MENVNDLVQEWLRDFDKGAKEYLGQMFIDVPDANGDRLTLNVDEYLQYRIDKK